MTVLATVATLGKVTDVVVSAREIVTAPLSERGALAMAYLHPPFATLAGMRKAPGIPASSVASFAPCAAARSRRCASVVRDAEEHPSGN